MWLFFALFQIWSLLSWNLLSIRNVVIVRWFAFLCILIKQRTRLRNKLLNDFLRITVALNISLFMCTTTRRYYPPITPTIRRRYYCHWLLFEYSVYLYVWFFYFLILLLLLFLISLLLGFVCVLWMEICRATHDL